jgi:hypothetical protein
MWIFLNNTFLSIVSAADRPSDLLVRARRAGDIEQVFPKARVSTTSKSDYRFRAFVSRIDVVVAIAAQVGGIDYTNFKDSVADEDRRNAYLGVWRQMFIWQGAIAEKLPPVAPPPIAAKAGKEPRRGLRHLFGGRAE